MIYTADAHKDAPPGSSAAVDSTPDPGAKTYTLKTGNKARWDSLAHTSRLPDSITLPISRITVQDVSTPPTDTTGAWVNPSAENSDENGQQDGTGDVANQREENKDDSGEISGEKEDPNDQSGKVSDNNDAQNDKSAENSGDKEGQNDNSGKQPGIKDGQAADSGKNSGENEGKAAASGQTSTQTGETRPGVNLQPAIIVNPAGKTQGQTDESNRSAAVQSTQTAAGNATSASGEATAGTAHASSDATAVTPQSARLNPEMILVDSIAPVVLLFDKNVYAIPETDPKIIRIAMRLAGDRDLHVHIEGHADKTGKAGYNLQLSEWRANTARNLLIDTYGIAPARVTTGFYGADGPEKETGPCRCIRARFYRLTAAPAGN